MNNITVDSEFQSLIPPLSEDEFARLEKSIIAEGVRDPIITWGGVIVDGHNRHAICEKHGIDCPSRDREFESRDAAKLFIISNQLSRRNLPVAAIGDLKLEEKEIVAKQAKERQREHGGTAPGKTKTLPPNLGEVIESGETLDILAKDIPLGRESLRKLDVIKREAKKGNPVAITEREKLLSGEKKSINSAYNSVTGKRKQRTAKESTAEDGRRICGICNEPINPGEAYDYEPTFHSKCRTNQHVIAQRKYRDADRSLRENVPTFSAKSLLAELHASAERLQSSWAQSFEINESMGVKLKASKKKRLEKIAADLIATIEKYQGEENGD